MTQDEINEMARKLYEHIGKNDYVIVALGVHGPNIDMSAGNVLATVRIGNDEETCEAKYLPDAITMARGRIIRKREAAAKKKKEKEPT